MNEMYICEYASECGVDGTCSHRNEHELKKYKACETSYCSIISVYVKCIPVASLVSISKDIDDCFDDLLGDIGVDVKKDKEVEESWDTGKNDKWDTGKSEEWRKNIWTT